MFPDSRVKTSSEQFPAPAYEAAHLAHRTTVGRSPGVSRVWSDKGGLPTTVSTAAAPGA
jgi:hypothetical protein